MVSTVIERLRGRICGLALDIDGTLTERRGLGHFLLSLDAVEAIRVAEARGVRVMLVTGNSAYIVGGISRYLGASGPHVGENGCVVYYRGSITSVCRDTARRAARIVEEELAGELVPSWQNPCRLHDYAFIPRNGKADVGRITAAIEELLAERGVRVKVGFSGYAIHLRPLDASKGRGLRYALRLVNLEPSCVIAVGDSALDIEMADAGVVLAAVGNADEELKKTADIVLPGGSGSSVRWLVEKLLK